MYCSNNLIISPQTNAHAVPVREDREGFLVGGNPTLLSEPGHWVSKRFLLSLRKRKTTIFKSLRHILHTLYVVCGDKTVGRPTL